MGNQQQGTYTVRTGTKIKYRSICQDSRHQDEEKEEYNDRVTEHGVVESNWRKTGTILAIALVDWRVGYPAV